MRFILAANFVRDMPWTPAHWAPVLAAGLAGRGHDVGLVLDGTESTFDPAAGYRVHIARPYRTHLGAHPGRFARLVQTLRQSDPGSVVLSLTPLYAGDLWLPIEPSPLQIARHLIRSLRPVSLALELSHHPWLPFEAWAAWRAPRPGTVRLSFDARPGTEPLPRVTTLTPPQADAAARGSSAVRSQLGVPHDRPLAALSLPELNPRALAPFLADLAAATADAPLTILAATSRPHTLESLADRAGLRHLVPITLSRSIHTILAACDLALTPPPQSPPPTAGHSGRWLADALALGVPIAAHADAHGSGLIASPQTLWRTRRELRASIKHAVEQPRDRTNPPPIPAAISLDRLLERLEALAALVVPARSATVPPRAR